MIAVALLWRPPIKHRESAIAKGRGRLSGFAQVLFDLIAPHHHAVDGVGAIRQA
jgi:hypothetical protein